MSNQVSGIFMSCQCQATLLEFASTLMLSTVLLVNSLYSGNFNYFAFMEILSPVDAIGEVFVASNLILSIDSLKAMCIY